jgi:protoporphyrinogen oxidase
VMERESEAGGLAAGFLVGDTDVYLEKFYHHLFRSDTAAIALINELGLGARLYWGEPNSSLLYQGKPYQLAGTVSSIMAITPLSFWDRLRLGAAGAFLKVLPSPAILEGQTAAVWLRRWMGRRAYEVVWEPQLRGKFGMYATEIAMPWMWARVHCRTNSLGYLKGGFPGPLPGTPGVYPGSWR